MLKDNKVFHHFKSRLNMYVFGISFPWIFSLMIVIGITLFGSVTFESSSGDPVTFTEDSYPFLIIFSISFSLFIVGMIMRDCYIFYFYRLHGKEWQATIIKRKIHKEYAVIYYEYIIDNLKNIRKFTHMNSNFKYQIGYQFPILIHKNNSKKAIVRDK